MKNKSKAGFLSAKLIFVLIAAVGVIILLFSLMRSTRFETIQLNLSEGQKSREDQLRELGQLQEDFHLDGKLVLTQANLSKYNKEKNASCNYVLKAGAPKTSPLFKSKIKGLQFSLPYSNEWGSDEFAVLEYDESDNMIYFGPVLTMPNCVWQRAYYVKLQNTKPTASILTDLNSRKIQGDLDFVKIKDKEAIKFIELNSDYDNCLSARMYLLGVNYDYEFVVTCIDDEETDFAFLEQILSTVKFD